jgi:glyoxylase-like metal-dependent hydrolase (beta-lactamase superfamily II)
MSGKTLRLQMGDITCIVLHEEPATASPHQPTVSDVQGQFPNATADEITDALQPDDVMQPSSMNALFIESAGTRILVDKGMGDAAGPALGHIPAALESEGIGMDDIDIVFITHFHGDHISGLLNADNTPRSPNSRPITAQAEWDYWMSQDTLNAIAKDRAADLRRIMAPLKDRFSFVNAGVTLAPGVTLADLAGHTPGTLAC